jgi:hypothetical protein
MGLAVLTTVLSTSTKLHMNELSSRMTVASQRGQEMLSGMAMKMTEMGVSDPAAASRKVLQSLLMRDAATWIKSSIEKMKAIPTAQRVSANCALAQDRRGRPESTRRCRRRPPSLLPVRTAHKLRALHF